MKLITVSQAQGRVPVTVFQINDRVNMGNTAELELVASEAYATGVRNLVLDLTRVPSLTSAGIRTIVGIYQMLAKQNDGAKHLKLVKPTTYVREVLEIAGLLDYLEIFDSLDAALASF